MLGKLCYSEKGWDKSWLFYCKRGTDGKSETARDKRETEIWLVVKEIREMEIGKRERVGKGRDKILA